MSQSFLQSLTQSMTLNKLIVLALQGGFVMLLLDIRIEHISVVTETWHAWIPLVYSALMALLIPASLLLWAKGGRKTLLVAFACSLVVGLLGVWFHLGEHQVRNLNKSVEILMTIPGSEGGGEGEDGHKEHELEHPDRPLLAPLAFVGLGLMGLMSCSKIFRSES